MEKLKGKKVALLVDHGFEEVELKQPFEELKKAEVIPHIVSPQKKKVRSWDFTDWGPDYNVDVSLDKANPADYDALILPGGQMNPDSLRGNNDALEFISHFIQEKKLIAAICHASWTLIELDFVKGKKMTTFKTIKKDAINAGAKWVDEEVVIDGNLLTSRSPDDLDAFCQAIIKALNK